jgi:hypothetical protein
MTSTHAHTTTWIIAEPASLMARCATPAFGAVNNTSALAKGYVR